MDNLNRPPWKMLHRDMILLAEMDNSNPALEKACLQMEGWADKIHLAQTIKDVARALFTQVRKENFLIGHSNIEIASACLYLACWERKVPRTYHEIGLATRLEMEKYSGCVETIKQELNIQLDPIKPDDYIPRFCSHLDLPFKFGRVATHVAEKALELGIVSGRSLVTISAAAILLVSRVSESQFKKKKETIGLVAGTSPSTIKDCYELMLPRVTELFPSDFVFTF